MRLIQDERETEKYKDETYSNFIEMMDGDELEVGLKGALKIQIQEWMLLNRFTTLVEPSALCLPEDIHRNLDPQVFGIFIGN